MQSVHPNANGPASRLMYVTQGESEMTLQARARLAGFLFLAVNALYIVSVLAGMAGPDEIRGPAVALQATASAATIAMAWSFYELLKPAGHGLRR